MKAWKEFILPYNGEIPGEMKIVGLTNLIRMSILQFAGRYRNAVGEGDATGPVKAYDLDFSGGSQSR